jgi:WhiB family redox-sensing transcriptional regulator
MSPVGRPRESLPFDPAELEWRDRALCAQTDPESFFPEKGGSTREAKQVCMGCEVRSPCLEYALEHQERFGIWGGLSERERRKLEKSRKPAAGPAAPSPTGDTDPETAREVA